MAQEGVCAYIHYAPPPAAKRPLQEPVFFHNIDLNNEISHLSYYICTQWVIEMNFICRSSISILNNVKK
jgi:hypothetical protein